MTSFVKPDRIGSVIQFVGDSAPVIPAGAADTVGVTLTHDWGPINVATYLTSFAEWTAKFGDSDTPGRTAAAGLFSGQGLAGKLGAGAAWVYRMATGSAAKATHAFTNTTPATALNVSAKYEGVKGNTVALAIVADPSNAANHIATVLVGGAKAEPSYTYAKTDLASLAAQINLLSSFITVAVAIDGVALTVTSATGTLLTGGNDGSSTTSTEFLAGLAAFEFKQFGIFAPHDLTDGPTLLSLRSWLQSQATANRPVRAVTGGPAAETPSAAITRVSAIPDEHIVSLGVGTWTLDLLGKDLSTSQLAPLVAGILAACGEEHSLSFKKIAGLHSTTSGPGSPSDTIATLRNNGVTVFSQAISADAELKIEQGVTTFVSKVTAGKPYAIYSDPRLIGIMDNFARNMKLWGDDIVIGDLPVNDDTRAAVYGHAKGLVDDLLRRGLILPGNPDATPPIPAPFVTVDDPGDPALADTIPFTFGWQFARTANYIFGQGHVR